MLWISEATGRQSRLLETAPAACALAPHAALPPAPGASGRGQGNILRLTYKKLHLPSGRVGSRGGPAGAFDLSSYIEPGPEAVALNRDRQQVGMGHGHPRAFTPASFFLEHLPQGPSPLLPLALCSDAWLGLSQSDGLCFALGFTWRGVHAYRASSLVLSQEEKGNKVSASSPTMAIAEAGRAA